MKLGLGLERYLWRTASIYMVSKPKCNMDGNGVNNAPNT